MRKVVLLAAALVVVLGVTASSATSASSETGITARNITIGGTFPLTGAASLYATIPAAMKAYFSYINSRKGPDGRRGIYGRQIVFKYYDDGYNPAQTVQATRRLVEEDKVFGIIGALGTEHNEAIRPYLNARKVPQILNATGASTWGRDAGKYPWTGGWQPDYAYEGRIYGQAIARNSPNAKIAVLQQNDSYGQDYLRGLREGLGAKASNIAAVEQYEVTATDVRAQMARLRGTGSTVLVILATPRFTVQAYVIANALRWSPAVIYTNSVSATDTFLTLAKSSGAGDLPDKTFTVQYAKDPEQPVVEQRQHHEDLQVDHGEVLPGRSCDRHPELLRDGPRARVHSAHVQGGEEPDAGRADEGVPSLERAQPVPPAGRSAEDRRRRPAPDPVRAGREVHRRHLPAGVGAQVRRSRDVEVAAL